MSDRGFSSSNVLTAAIAPAVLPLRMLTCAFPCNATSSLGESASAASKSASACSSRNRSRLSRPRCARIFGESGLIASPAAIAAAASS